jgi:hypothetical protein
MRATFIAFVITALCASVASGQTPAEQGSERVFYFTHTDTVQGMQEVSTLIRGIGDFPQVSTDTVKRSLTVHGTAPQIALAEWLFNELDQATEPPAAKQGNSLVMHEYRTPGGGDDVVRVIYPTYTATVRELQEVAVLVRTIADIRRLFTYNAPRAVAFRGTADQMALAEWMFNELNKPVSERTAAHLYRMPGTGDDIVRLFYLTNTTTVQEFQEVATLVRSIGDIRLLFTYNAPKAVALRGTSDQGALTEWLLHELDKPADWRKQAQGSPDSATREYRMPGSNEGIVHVHYLTDIATVQRFQQIVTSVRKASNIRRAFTYNSPRAVAFRGTADQIALADRLITEQDKP